MQLEQFLIIDLHPALALDSLGTSHPVLVPVDAPSEINEIFDGISYKKANEILIFLILSVYTVRPTKKETHKSS